MGHADALLVNKGLVSVDAVAFASGAGGAASGSFSIGSAHASATASYAILQLSPFIVSVSAMLENAGTASAVASAVAIGRGTEVVTRSGMQLTGAASAFAAATGVGQHGFEDNELRRFNMENSGSITVEAKALAKGVDQALAQATAQGEIGRAHV